MSSKIRSKYRSGDAMDEYLASLGLWRKPTARDNSCLYRAVAEQLFHTQSQHTKLRDACLKYLEKNTEPMYCSFPGQIEIKCLSELYNCDFIVYQDIGKPPVNVTAKDLQQKVYLCFSGENHYDSVYKRTYIESAAICQSLVYELLYQAVFEIDAPIEQGMEMISRPYKIRHSSSSVSKDCKDKDSSPIGQGTDMGSGPYKPQNSSPSGSKDCGDKDSSPAGQGTTDMGSGPYKPQNSSPSGSKDSKDKDSSSLSPATDQQSLSSDQPTSELDSSSESPKGDRQLQRTIPFPYKVAKALAPDIYRNVELDAWMESRRDPLTYDYGKMSEPLFVPGDKCQVFMDSRTYNAHVQDISGEKGPVSVFVEELGEKREVSLENLIPLPRIFTQDSYGKRRYRGRTNDFLRMMPIVSELSQHHGDAMSRGRSYSNRDGPPSSPRFSGVRMWRGRGGSSHPGNWGTSQGKYHRRQRTFSEGHVEEASSREVRDGQSRGRKSFDDSTTYRDYKHHRQQYYTGLDKDYCRAPDIGQVTITDHYPEAIDSTQRSHRAPYPAPGPVLPAVEGSTGPLQPTPSPLEAQNGLGPQVASSTQGYVAAVPFFPYLPIPHPETLVDPINFNAPLSCDRTGVDLPYHDVCTLRFFYNLGVQYYHMMSMMQSPAQAPPFPQQYLSTPPPGYGGAALLPPEVYIPTTLEEEYNGQYSSTAACQQYSVQYLQPPPPGGTTIVYTGSPPHMAIGQVAPPNAQYVYSQ